MSRRTFGTFLKIAGIIAVAVVAITIAGPLLAGVAFSLSTFGTAVLAGGLIAINIGNALSRDMPAISAQDIAGRLNIRQDPNASRDVLIGTVGTAGVLRYKNLIEGIGDEPDILWLVVVLAGYPCDGLDSFIFNGQTITVNGDGSTAGAFAGKLFVYFRKGDETDHAFPALVDGVWDAKARRGRGLCCAAIKVITDEVFEGKVEPLFVVRGAKLFNPRLDTAWGGSGSHDFGDDTTFEHSNNPSQAKLTFLRGFYIQDSGATDVLIAGRGLKDKETTRFDFANWIASANTDEDQIPVVGGGNIDRYTADGIIQAQRPLDETIKILDAAQAGTTVFSGGKYRSYPGIYRAPTLTFGEADIIGVPRRLDIRKGQDAIINIVHGSFASADDRYELRNYPRQKDAASITRVGEMQRELNLPFTTDHRMAQRIALISMRQANAQRSFTATFSHRALRLAPGGETVQIDYPHFDFVNEVMRLTTWALIPAEDAKGMPGLNVDMILVQDLSSFYSWTAASDELSIVTPGQAPGARGPGSLTVQQINERRDAKTFLRFTGGADNKIEIADNNAWDMPNSTTRSIEFAFKPVAIGSDFTIVTKRAAADGKGFQFSQESGADKLQFLIDIGASIFTMKSDAALVPGRWYHVALTRDAVGVFNLYLDKILQSATLTNNSSLVNSASVLIGLNFQSNFEFAGNFQDLRFWSDVRTLAEIGQNALAVLVGDEAGLIGLWRCDEGHGGTIHNLGSVATSDGTIFDLASKVFWGGAVGEGLPAVDIALTTGGDLAANRGMDQGDAIIRSIPFGSTYLSGRDTDALTYSDAYDVAPFVAFIRGGGTFDGSGLSNTAIHQNAIEAIGVNATGFTVQAELKETASSLVGHIDGEGSGTETAWNSGNGPTDPDWQAGKEATAAAWNNKYTWKYTVSVDGPPEPGDITLGFYTNINGAGWIKQGQATHLSDATNATRLFTVSGLSTAGPDGDLYGVDIETSSGATLDDVIDVRYDTATAPATVTATPTGAEDEIFFVSGGME